jgi:hypothetical protein
MKSKYHKAFEWLLSAATLIFLLVVYVEIPTEIKYPPIYPDEIEIKHPLDYLKEGNGASDYVRIFK